MGLFSYIASVITASFSGGSKVREEIAKTEKMDEAINFNDHAYKKEPSKQQLKSVGIKDAVVVKLVVAFDRNFFMT